MDPWTPPHLKGKKCLPLLAHRTRPTWYLSNHVFNTATVYPFYFWKNYDKTSHNCTSDPIIITDLKGKQKHKKLVFLQEDFRNTPSQRRSPAPQLDRLVPERVSKRSSLSLDLNANENGVSEESGSESEGEGDKMPLGYLNRVFHIGAKHMFEILFTDSSFIRRFMDARKITNITSTAWQKDSSGNMKRSLNYTITINNPLIGKFSTATEYQTLYKESRDGQYYLINSEVYTHDVPYHDYFYTQTRYYIMSNSKRKCRLRVYTDVKYKKQPWGLVKSFITKNSWRGIEENFRHLEAELLEEEAEMNQGGGEAGKIGGLRRRRRTYSRTLAEHSKPKKQYRHDAEQHREGNMGTDAF
uniref:GRAM domain containing 1c n=1 Tax=Neolamprologus brichardi TaxID=32507 RepID=A0A3Q4I5E4_NEOBR